MRKLIGTMYWKVNRMGVFCVFFFFQAEDGIRDKLVTGVQTCALPIWTVVNERDELGSDLVPDYLTSVADGAFYGWPYSYFGRHVDARVTPPRADLVAKAVKPDYALGTHVAPLGLAFGKDGAYIGQHGSWNRKPRSGYNVVFVPFKDGRPVGLPQEVLSGFISSDGEAYGRPVGVALDRQGA